ncbi:MAG: alanine dehydrogenase [Gammaproteobacteria bacterium]|nr:alanine dehydrogenase [Gammaproteobacteria bacterium]
MKIGVPKEIKKHEHRVGLTPAGVIALVNAGHQVQVETNAGAKTGFTDQAYKNAGAGITVTAEDAYRCEMIIKVKEPQPGEYALLQEGQMLFTYLHLAPDPQQTQALLERKIIGIAYETVTDDQGRLPLLTPMSEVAGRLAVQAGAYALQMANGGSGTLLGGVPGVAAANVVIIGGGVVGTEAAKIALGVRANVTILDTNINRLRYLDDVMGPAIKTRFSDAYAIDELTASADLVIGAVLIPGKQAPKLITRQHLQKMKTGSVFVDVAIDQGGCAETSRPTTHSDPIYIEDGVVHYCVANMPGAAARTSTMALTNATLPYVLQLANKGWPDALKENPGLKNGLNVYLGQVTNQAVAEDLGHACASPDDIINNPVSRNIKQRTA